MQPAVLIEEPFKLKNIEVEEPESPGPGEALLRVHTVGICGSDFGGYLGKMPFFSYPRIFGHELGVEVLEVGAGVENVKPGDRCSIEPYITCGACIACRRGYTNCCRFSQTYGVHCDGGMRHRVLFKAKKLHPATSLDYDELALVETLGIGFHAVERAGVREGENVLVIGSGPIGLGAIAFAKIAGARVLVMDKIKPRLRFCKDRLGIEHTVLADDNSSEQVSELTGGDMPTVVIDATGNNKSMCAALELAAHTARVVYVGISTEEICFRHPVIHARELTLLASRNALSANFKRIIELIEKRQLDTDPWITHHTDLENIVNDFSKFLEPDSGVIKALVHLD